MQLIVLLGVVRSAERDFEQLKAAEATVGDIQKPSHSRLIENCHLFATIQIEALKTQKDTETGLILHIEHYFNADK